LLILGAGVHAEEMVEIVARTNAGRPTWNLLGFISPDGTHVGKKLNGLLVVGTPEDLASYADAWFVPDNDWPCSIDIPEERLTTIIDPSAFVSRTARIGPGCVIYPNCYIGLNASLGKRVFCLSGCVINHDDVVEDHVVMASQVALAGSVHVEAGCYLGQSCTVREYLRIGRGSLIGMAAVVCKDVPPGSVMVGNPARFLRMRTDANRAGSASPTP